MRLILIILIGTILGTIWGLYFKNITFILLLILFIILRHKGKYVRLIFKPKYLIIFAISFIIANTYFNIRNAMYEKTYNLIQNTTYVIGKVISKRRRERIHMAVYSRTKANWLK